MSDNFNIDYAVVSAFERSKVDQTKRGSGRTFTMILMAVFFILLMIGLAAGVTIYRGVATQHERTNNLHMQSGLLVNTVRMNDATDMVALGAGPEGDALVLVERLDSGTYETRIYQYEGDIVQEYAISGRPYKPENAVKLVTSDVFEFSYEDGVLSIMTDQGIFDVAIRSPQSGSPNVASAGAQQYAQAYGVANSTAETGGNR